MAISHFSHHWITWRQTDIGILLLMIFKTGCGKQTLFSEHPSRAKISISLKQIIFIWRSPGQTVQAAGLHQLLSENCNLNFHWKPYRHCTQDLSCLWEGWCIPMEQLRTRCCRSYVCLDSSTASPAGQGLLMMVLPAWLLSSSLWAPVPCSPDLGSHHPMPCKDSFMLFPECSLQFLSPLYLLNRHDHFEERLCSRLRFYWASTPL